MSGYFNNEAYVMIAMMVVCVALKQVWGRNEPDGGNFWGQEFDMDVALVASDPWTTECC